MKSRVPFINIVVLTVVSFACQTLVPPATATSTPPPTPTLTSTATPLPTATPTITPTPTPLPPPSTLSSEAAELCEAARTQRVLNKPVAGPVMAMLKTTYAEQPDWGYFSVIPYFTAQSASEVKTIFCVEESRSQVSSYTDGQPGYRLNWTVRAVDLESGDVLASKSFYGEVTPPFKSHSGPAYGSPPTKQLFTWALENLHDKSVLFVEEAVAMLAFLPDGQHIAAGTKYRANVTYSGSSFNAKIFIFDLTTGEVVHTLIGHKQPIEEMAVSPNGRFLASSSFKDHQWKETVIKVWDLDTGRELHSLKTNNRVKGLAFSTDSQLLAIGEYDKISLVDASSGKIVNTIEQNPWSFFFTPDNQLAVVNTEEGSVRFDLLDPESGTWLDSFSLDHSCFLAASLDGTRVALCGAEDSTAIVNMDAPHDRLTLPFDTPSLVIAFAQNRFVFAPYEFQAEHDIQVWDINTVEPIFTFRASPTAIAFSPDGRLLASGENEGFIKIWEIPTP